MAFGDLAHHLFGAASVVEMTGDFTLTLPVMLAVAIASTVSRALGYGTIYTTKLLRRGTDIDRATPWRILQDLKVSDAMHAFQPPLELTGAWKHNGHGPEGAAVAAGAGQPASANGRLSGASPVVLPGPVTGELDPQAIFATESLAQALRQLEIYGRDGLPVVSDDAQQITGWVTNANVIGAVAREIRAAQEDVAQAQQAAEAVAAAEDQTAGHRFAPAEDGDAAAAPPRDPLPGYRIVEITLPDDSPAVGTELGDITWPPGYLPVSLLRNLHLRPPEPHLVMRPGDRIALLTPEPS